MLFRKVALLSLVAILVGCAGNQIHQNPTLPTVSSPEKQGVKRASGKILLNTYLSSRVRDPNLSSSDFKEISRRLIPLVEREHSAAESSGIKTDTPEVEHALEKIRQEFSKLPDQVYEIFGVEVKYSVPERALVVEDIVSFSYKNDSPLPPNFRPYKGYVTDFLVKPKRIRVVIPMTEEAYRQELYLLARRQGATSATIAHKLGVLVHYRPHTCKFIDEYLSCHMDILATTVFEVNSKNELTTLNPAALVIWTPL